MLDIIKYSKKYEPELVKLIDDFQDYLISIDTFDRLSRSSGYGEKYTNELLSRIKSDKGVIFLALSDDQVAGVIVGVMYKILSTEMIGHKKKYKRARVLELFVKSEFRSGGVGSRLMSEMEKYFKEKKCDQINIEVFAPNTKAHEFYRKLGYQNESIDLVKDL